MRRLAGQTRRSVKLAHSLNRELSGYVLAAGAAGVSVLALVPPSEGQIVFTPAHERIERSGAIFIDLNHDGIRDLTIREVTQTLGSHQTFHVYSVEAITPKGGAIRCGSYSRRASALVRGASIGPSSPLRAGKELMVQDSAYGVSFYGGYWLGDVVNKFLGIRFQIGQETHYGWARLDVQLGPLGKGIGVKLTGYAYETRPDTAIRAGDRGGADGSDENSDSTSGAFSIPEPEVKQSGLGELALGASGTPLLRREQ
jgi:hypothetical protein